MSVKIAQKEITQLGQNGTLLLTGRKIRQFAEFDIPDVTQTLDLSNNLLTDFQGFEPQNHLKSLIVDGNPLVSFKGIPTTTGIQHFSAINSPIAALPNFRMLAVIAFYPSIRTINGIEVQKSELNIPYELYLRFSHRHIVDHNKEKEDEMIALFKSFVAKGWVPNVLPWSLEAVKQDAEDMENDALSVRAARVFNYIHKVQTELPEYFRWVYDCQEPKKARVSQDSTFSARLDRQRELITFMQMELETLKNKAASKEETTKKSRRQLSQATENEYEQLLKERAGELIQNAEIVENSKPYNPEGVRKAVAKLLNVDPSTDMSELAIMLQKSPLYQNALE